MAGSTRKLPSPYEGVPLEQWKITTQKLIEAHPLPTSELVEAILQVWDDILESGIGSKPFKIGVDLFPRPQMMAFFLHELVPLELAHRYPNIWRREETTREKDVVYIPDPSYSIEIKTSSSPNKVFGNRSYTQETSSEKKEKSGYYLTINFESFYQKQTIKGIQTVRVRQKPRINLIRFGWLDQGDWAGQKAASGQQASLDTNAYLHKLLTLFPI